MCAKKLADLTYDVCFLALKDDHDLTKMPSF